MTDTAATIERVWLSERRVIVSSLARRLGDLQLAEDSLQEALATALARWPLDGIPDSPGAWLMTAAWRRALDARRRDGRLLAGDDAVERASDAAAARPVEGQRPEPDTLVHEDDTLVMLLACCHPALTLEARIALTLRHVAGLAVDQIAAAFLVPATTMEKRLVRARAKIRDAGIALERPRPADVPSRLISARAAVYLIYTEGHSSSRAGSPVRRELCTEAVWLAEQLVRLDSADEESLGLLALLVLLEARAASRTEFRVDDPAAAELILADDQDRTKWSASAIARGRELLATTSGIDPGPLQLQAAIALLHASAPRSEDTDWRRIAQLYAALAHRDPSPVVEAHRAYAVGRAMGPQAGLLLADSLLEDARLRSYAPLHAIRADLLDRAGLPVEAAAARDLAARWTPNDAQRNRILRGSGRADGAVT